MEQYGLQFNEKVKVNVALNICNPEFAEYYLQTKVSERDESYLFYNYQHFKENISFALDKKEEI